MRMVLGSYRVFGTPGVDKVHRIGSARERTRTMIRFTVMTTELGSFAFVARDGRLVATFTPSHGGDVKRFIRERWPDAVETPRAMPPFRRQIMSFFAGRPTAFDVEIDVASYSPFQQRIFEACRCIPYGKTASYGELAAAAGAPGAARAVGNTMARNPIPIVIPCHRVVRSDGSLGGFSSPAGTREKLRLLELEGARFADCTAVA